MDGLAWLAFSAHPPRRPPYCCALRVVAYAERIYCIFLRKSYQKGMLKGNCDVTKIQICDIMDLLAYSKITR